MHFPSSLIRKEVFQSMRLFITAGAHITKKLFHTVIAGELMHDAIMKID